MTRYLNTEEIRVINETCEEDLGWFLAFAVDNYTVIKLLGTLADVLETKRVSTSGARYDRAARAVRRCALNLSKKGKV